MKKVIYTIIVATLLLTTGCTKDNYIDTGICNGRFDGNLMEYMEANPYDWSMTVEMVRHAGDDMVRLFEGKDPNHKEITFFGPTNHSIRRYLLMKKKTRVSELDAEWCRDILLQFIVDGKIYRKDIPAGIGGSYGTVGTGGTELLTTLGKTQIWLYVDVDEANGIVLYASRPVFITFLKSKRCFAIGSADIEPDNCVVDALEYKFTLDDAIW